MEIIRIKPPIPLTGRLLQAGACILVLTLIGGCMGSYGNYNRDSEVFEAFNNQRVPPNYRYYYYHSGSEPIAVIGVEKKYDAGSRMWREVDPNTEKFKDLIHWIWEDIGYDSFAARINVNCKPGGHLGGFCQMQEPIGQIWEMLPYQSEVDYTEDPVCSAGQKSPDCCTFVRTYNPPTLL